MSANSTTEEDRFRLSDSNWIEWQAYVEGKLLMNDLDMYLEPPTLDADGKPKVLNTDETRKAKKAFGFVRMHLTKKFLDMTEHCKSAPDLWSTLKNHFQKAEKNIKMFNIQRLVQMAKSPPPVEDLAMSIRATAAKIGDVKVNSETFMVGFYTALLPSDFSDLRVMGLTAKDEMTLTDAAEVVKNEISQKSGKQMLAAQTKRNPKNRQRNDSKTDPEQQCTYCARTNHTVEKCFVKQKADALKQKSSGKSEDRFRVSAIVEKVCGLAKRSDRHVWYLDSGSQSHTVNCDDGFVSLREGTNVALQSAAGDDIDVKGIGVYHIRSKPNLVLELKECIYAPSLIANFLSSGKLNDNGMDVLLRRDGACLVFDDDGIVATGQLKNGMYVMNLGANTNVNEKNIIAAQVKQRRSLIEWHKALGHLNVDDLRSLLKRLEIKTDDDSFECKPCLLAKMTRKPHKSQEIESTHPLEKVHTDLSGIIRTPALGNYSYFLTFIDDYSRYTTVYLVRSKDEVCEKFIYFKAFVENKFERKIKQLRSDNGTEYTNDRFQKVISESGIDHQRTQVKTPQQNGVAERINRTIGNNVRSALIASGLPSRYWPYAVQHVVQMRNVSPCSSIDNQVPYQLWHGKCANYDEFHPFGCTAIVYNENAMAKMVDPKGIECRMLCLSTNKKGYVLLNASDDRLIESGNVKFMKDDASQAASQNSQSDRSDVFEVEWETDESCCDEAQQCQQEPVQQQIADIEPMQQPFVDGELSTENSYQYEDVNRSAGQQPTPDVSSDPAAEIHSELDVETEIDHSTTSHTPGTVQKFSSKELERFKLDNPGTYLQPLPGAPTIDKTRPGRPVKQYRYMISYMSPNRIVDDALSSDESQKWKEAMDQEYDALIKNSTWTLTELPLKVKPIKTRWVLNKKNEANGIRYKARLVVRGFAQSDSSVGDTYAPVIRSSSIRLLLSFALKNDLHVHHLDVKNAYLNSPLKDEIYIEQPYGYEKKTKRNLVCKLNKAMYGLRQAARCWNETLNAIMDDLGLNQFVSEECIYASKGNELLVGAYVDDLIVVSASEDIIVNFKKRLIEKVRITDNGNLTKFIGINVTRTDDKLELSQQELIQELVDSCGLEEANGSPTPIAPGMELDVQENDQLCDDVKEYQSIVGSLMYIAGCTRPDIQFTANQLGKYMSKPMDKHLKVAKRVVRYLKQTIESTLVYRKCNDDKIVICADSNFDGDEESLSTSGVTVFHAGSLISWSSVKQELVAKSTCEAEINAITEGATDAVYFRELIAELTGKEMDYPTVIFNDSRPALDTLASGGKHARTKHYKRRINYIKKLQKSNIIVVEHEGTKEMVADAFTKALSEQQLVYLMKKCGLNIHGHGHRAIEPSCGGMLN